MKKLILLSCALMISGCSILQPVKTPQITQYVLHNTPRPYIRNSDNETTLLVSAPTTNPVFDTTEILYSDTPLQTNSYAVSRWARNPGQMIQPLIVRTLQQSRYFHAVVAPPFSGHFDYSLNTQILCLQHVYRRSGGFVKFIASAQVIDNKTKKVVQEKTFNITQRMRFCSVQCGVQATNIAVEKFLRQLTIFTVRTIETR